VRVVADSHAIVWYVQGSKRLSERAGEVLAEAEAERSLVVSVATLIDLWYVSQTTQSVTAEQLAALRERLASSEAVALEPVTAAIADARPVSREPASPTPGTG
jgi:PIN domain nuclease of toxin-antitoxin system